MRSPLWLGLMLVTGCASRVAIIRPASAPVDCQAHEVTLELANAREFEGLVDRPSYFTLRAVTVTTTTPIDGVLHVGSQPLAVLHQPAGTSTLTLDPEGVRAFERLAPQARREVTLTQRVCGSEGTASFTFTVKGALVYY